VPTLLLDGRRICSGGPGIFEGSRRPARKDSDRWEIAFEKIVIPNEVEGSHKITFEVMPRDSSTSLRAIRNDLGAVLLAGGESRRMGTDKATFFFRGRPLWQNQLELLRKLKPAEIFISARTDPQWRPQDVTFVGDIPPSRGPLSGLAAAVNRMTANHLLALAIDVPWMSSEYLEFLCAQIDRGRGVLPKIGDRAEPLAAIYPRESVIETAKALAGTDFSLQSLTCNLLAVGKLRAIPVTQSEQEFFRNINEFADLESHQAL
jgi:molybdopterin-guanine dinucleotide biosynthesis protein A